MMNYMSGRKKYSDALNKYKGMAEAYQGVLNKVNKLELENEKILNLMTNMKSVWKIWQPN